MSTEISFLSVAGFREPTPQSAQGRAPETSVFPFLCAIIVLLSMIRKTDRDRTFSQIALYFHLRQNIGRIKRSVSADT